MHTNLKTLAAVALVSALAAAQAQTTAGGTAGGPSTAAKPVHKAHRKPKAPPQPTVQDQIESLRQDMQTQIQSLKQQLSDRDAQLQQAQQAAASAQAAAAQAQQAASAQQAAVTETNQQVSSLNGAVADLKTNNASLVQTIQDDQKNTRKAIENPDALHFKGITLSPTGSFLAAETVWRSAATGGDINTPFTGIPFDSSNAGKLSEFFGSGRQSRVAMLGEGKISNMTMRGYYEADFLSAGVTSNNNQSNSYTLRQRQMWAQAELQSGWTFTGGQMWSLVTETKAGMTNRTEALPQTIDAQYAAGFNWERQYGFRVTKKFGQGFWLGAAAENAETLNPGGSNLPTNLLIGTAGVGGGLYNLNANYSFNLAPDLIVKTVFEPGWGHYELYGVARFFRDRIYPNAGAATPSSAGAYNDSTTGGGIGGSLRVPTFAKKLDVGLKGMWGDGMGRYENSGLSDLTLRPNGQLALLHQFSALGTLELHATPRLDVYVNYGGDYIGRHWFVDSTGKAVGYGSPMFDNSGCSTEPLPGGSFSPSTPSKCAGNNRDVQETVLGYWYDLYKGPAGRLRQGIQYSYFERQTWAGMGGAPKGTDNMLFTSFRYYLP